MGRVTRASGLEAQAAVRIGTIPAAFGRDKGCLDNVERMAYREVFQDCLERGYRVAVGRRFQWDIYPLRDQFSKAAKVFFFIMK